ncbi:hypothetical protein C0Q70_20501 [Pomacea canaliculata]|uniref:Uncharacterized protein n=1 Tax=Pomacea canaliculata TaxID=400727 RepID=A0A2T7NFQ1_POMCA|nr:hypothetical protein C0Q70_20501 [Pomacea canaliculata]
MDFDAAAPDGAASCCVPEGCDLIGPPRPTTKWCPSTIRQTSIPWSWSVDRDVSPNDSSNVLYTHQQTELEAGSN